LINEPPVANAFKNPLLIFNMDRTLLQGLYQKAKEVIRKNDVNKIIFFSASQQDIWPIMNGIIRPTTFTETPSKGTEPSKEMMVDHSYCCSIVGSECEKNGEPLITSAQKCRDFHFRKLTQRKKDADNLKTGVIFNEFGACKNSDSCVEEITSVADASDSL